MSIMDTLITNRTQADVTAGNAKGNYNASDLNRVGEAEEYLHDLFEAYGYSMPNYKRIKLSRPGHYEIQTVTKPILPDGYTQLEYLQSTGTQYIVTGLNSTTRYDHEITFSDYAYAKTQGILGSNTWYYSYVGYNDTLRWCMSDRCYDTPGSVTSKRTAKLGYNYLTVDGSSVSQQSDTNGIPSDTTHTLFKGYNCASVKIYSYRASLDGQSLRDFVPCKRNSDDELGMYDLVNDVFYTNEGTGTFTAGPENIEYETITEEVLVPDERDPYTWFEDDIPTSGMMAQYITNLSELRGQFVQAETTPSVPPKMNELTWKEANNIEKILEDVDALLTNIAAAWFYSGDLFSGEV